MGVREEAVLLFDGACGSNLQTTGIPHSAYGGHDGCNEFLNLSLPDAIVSLHRSFLDAGSNVVETNTFGANAVVLAEYGLEGRVAEINAAAVANAKAAIAASGKIAYVAGSVGPTTKLPSIGHIGRAELRTAFAEQMTALVSAGVDLLVVETCQDLLQLKIALDAAFEVVGKCGRDVPVMASVTLESTGTMLVGTDLPAVAAALEPFPLFSLGLNCATGPEAMVSSVAWLSKNWPKRISVMPNAGLPEVVDGRTRYPLSPEGFAKAVASFVTGHGVSIVGGCCGTTPGHLSALAEALRGATPAKRSPSFPTMLSSLYQAVEARQEIPPLLIGERTNANGSKAFRERILADDFAGALSIAVEQERNGAHAIDLCTAYAGRDEVADLSEMARLVAKSVRLPVVVDSTTPAAVEAALSLLPGRSLVNSIHLEDGGKTLAQVCAIAKRHGAAVVALAIDETGMAMTADEKVAVARRIHDLAVGTHGLREKDIFFDALTFTVGSGDETLAKAAAETLAAIRAIRRDFPEAQTVLGVSNVSFGLPTHARRALSSVFLHEAVEAGLTAAIVDPAKVVPLASIPDAEREACLDLLYDRPVPDGTPLSRLIALFTDGDGTTVAAEAKGSKEPPAEEALAKKVLAGDKEGLDDLISILLSRRTAASIVNDLLVPAMRTVGDLFGRGEMLLPFVLQSAEVMKKAVDKLAPHMTAAERRAGRKILLATVAGDVHDIGKNLVGILMANNGYEVIDIGIKVPTETVVAEAKRHDVDAIGLSGLLVKSAIGMKEGLPRMKEAGLSVPVMLGGAALTRGFVARECAPLYDGPVVYCPDAFSGLSALRSMEAGTLSSTTPPDEIAATTKSGRPEEVVDKTVPVPTPPFLGSRHVTGIDPSLLFPLVNEQALFRGRWGYRRGRMAAADYAELIDGSVRPLYEEIKRRVVNERLVAPSVAYGWYKARSEGDSVVIVDGAREFVLPFPRQGRGPHRCIADYLRSADEGGDVVGFFVATVGSKIGDAAKELLAADRYRDYLLLHAVSVELADALAEYWHERMREELGFPGHPSSAQGYVVQEYRGSRYGFGYPACPDLGAHLPLFDLLDPGAIGVTLTESMEMVPEATTSAIVIHHPQAKYFAV